MPLRNESFEAAKTTFHRFMRRDRRRFPIRKSVSDRLAEIVEYLRHPLILQPMLGKFLRRL